MPKKIKAAMVVVKCECSVCGQVANAQPNTEHHYCRGIRLVGPLPGLFSGLRKPDNKGTWLPWKAPVAPPVQDANVVPAEVPSSHASESQGVA